MFNLGYGIKAKLEGTGFTQFALNVETGIISLSKTGGFLKITNASYNQMHVVRQGIFQIKTSYNFSRIDSDIHKPKDRKSVV